MPNWIEGTLKLRGKRDNIKRFLDNGLEASSWFDEESEPIEHYVVDESGVNYIEYSFHDEPHIKGTRRAFITGDYVYMDDDEGVVTLNIKQAWSFNSGGEDLDKWQKISKEYDLDLRLYGIECGVQFCHEIIITKHGENVVENVIQYEDWEWECPFPNMGG